ncbi:DMT family transporter [Anaerosporobacter sp.]
MKTKNITYLAKLALFVAALIWGSSFFILKNTVNVFPPNMLLAIRFIIAFILLGGIYHKRLRLINKTYVISGLIIGFFLFIAYCTQTIGLTDTTPGKNAFLTAIYCVLVPFLYWFVNHTRPDLYNFLAALLCFIGIGFVSLTSNLTIATGDLLTLLGGFFFAVHMIAVAKLTKDRDPILITILQFGFAGIFCLITSLIFESFPKISHISTGSIFNLLYLAIFATAIALLLQNVGQKYTHPSAASLILSLESVFGVIFSVMFFGDTLSAKLVIGFILIFISIIVSETKLSFLRKERNKSI